MKDALAFAVWRHPKPAHVQGRCIGRTDVRVDRRKAKRLAHRIRAWARRNGAARVVITSDLQRAASVGRCLARWGWQHRIDTRLRELDFGDWDGKTWARIGADPVGAWCEDFAVHPPGGGEPVSALLARCAAFLDEPQGRPPHCVVAHAGWISAAQWLQRGELRAPTALEWPAAVGYASLVRLGPLRIRARPGL